MLEKFEKENASQFLEMKVENWSNMIQLTNDKKLTI